MAGVLLSVWVLGALAVFADIREGGDCAPRPQDIRNEKVAVVIIAWIAVISVLALVWFLLRLGIRMRRNR